MFDWLHQVADITGVLGFAFGVWAYYKERGTRKRLEEKERELADTTRALDRQADKATIYRDQAW